MLVGPNPAEIGEQFSLVFLRIGGEPCLDRLAIAGDLRDCAPICPIKLALALLDGSSVGPGHIVEDLHRCMVQPEAFVACHRCRSAVARAVGRLGR